MPPTRHLHVLCAEDNPFGRVVLNTILGELGHRADFVSSGEGAYASVARADFDALLMDVTLSGLDGTEATRRIRALPAPRGQIPIIGISGRSTPEDEAAARAAGMNAYLTKPISAKLLAETLTALTEGSG
jgi:CheY-like chemotaxis protein